MFARGTAIVLILILALLATGCGSIEPTARPVELTASPFAPIMTPTARAATPVRPAPTPDPPAASATPPEITLAPTRTEAAAGGAEVPLEPEPTVASTIVEEVRFQSDQFTLVGDLQIPNTGGRHPAIIMVHGSGRSDRMDNGKYLPLMKRFLRAGYAVLCWDKPGVGASTGKLARDSEVLSERSAILVDAVELLAQHPAIDPGRIGVWGISQAGYVMPMALTLTGDIAFVIVISGPAMDSYDQGAFLVGQRAFCAGATEEEARLIERRISALEKATTYKEYLDNIMPLYEDPILKKLGVFRNVRPEDEWEPEDRSRAAFFNPMEVVGQSTVPVLAVFGENDRQVDPFQGSEAYREALRSAGNPASHVELYADADHNIVLSETGCLDKQDARPAADWLKYAPGYLDLMEQWLLQLSGAAD